MAKVSKSEIFQITNCPVPKSLGNHHEGVDNLLRLMADKGLNFYKTHKDMNIGGPEGLLDSTDVVLVKVNAQWKYRGCTNSDVVRGGSRHGSRLRMSRNRWKAPGDLSIFAV